MDIYFFSTGKNSVCFGRMCRPIQGLISDSDIVALQTSTAKRIKIFGQHLAKIAIAYVNSGGHVQTIVDGIYKTSYIAAANDSAAVVNLSVGKAVHFIVLMLHRGKRLLCFGTATATAIRVRILS